MTILRRRLEDLSYGFLLVPGGITLGFIIVALLAVQIDLALKAELPFSGDASGARELLSTIGGSLITVAGVAFSITIVTLQLVSSQFSPRALTGFLADRLNQIVAGVFLGTFAYCLLVLGSVREETDQQGAFVPAIGVMVAVVLALVSLGVLLVFIHHMSESLQVSKLTSSIARRALGAVEELYPEPYGKPVGADLDAFTPSEGEEAPAAVHPERPGFVQMVAMDDIARRSGAGRDGSAQERPVVVRIRVAPGDIVTTETVVAELWPASEAERVGPSARRAVRVVDSRDIRQDVGYGIRQLVDIALRAISPAINDPTTAVNCLAYLRAITERLAAREFPQPVRVFRERRLTIAAHHRSFEDLASEAFAEIARYGHDPRMMGEVLAAIGGTAAVARRAKAPERASFLADLATTLAQPAIDGAATDADRRYLEDALAAVGRAAAGTE